MNYVDIHSHILPGADDGAKDMEQALAILKAAAENGIGKIIATPHQKENRRSLLPEEIKCSVEALQEKANRQGISIRIYGGNELWYRKGLGELLEKKQVCTLADSAYTLVEFSPKEEFIYIRNGLYEILSAGYYPVLAHAERCQCLIKKEERIAELVNMGCYIQVNAGSVLGELGTGIKWFLHKLFCDRNVHFVATDAHDTNKRNVRTGECARRLEKKYGAEYAEELLNKNGECVIANREI